MEDDPTVEVGRAGDVKWKTFSLTHVEYPAGDQVEWLIDYIIGE